MQTSTGFTTHRNQIKLQEFPLVARIFIAILLAAALIAWAPRKASAAGTGETASSGCANPTYWDNFFAYTPNTPNIAQSPCFIPLTGANTLPASSPSLYWEYFFKEDPVGPHIAPPFSLPVTGADTLSDSNASLDVETPLIPVTSVPEALPASIADYSPAQHAQYQITEPLEAPALPAFKPETLPSSIDDYTPAQRAQYQITEPLEALRAQYQIN